MSSQNISITSSETKGGKSNESNDCDQVSLRNDLLDEAFIEI